MQRGHEIALHTCSFNGCCVDNRFSKSGKNKEILMSAPYRNSEITEILRQCTHSSGETLKEIKVLRVWKSEEHLAKSQEPQMNNHRHEFYYG